MNDLLPTPPRSFHFGPFVLVPERQSLTRHGVPVRLGGRALDILATLLERPGELVSKRTLIDRVWPDVVVDESNLKVNMAALRRGLGDGTADQPDPYIATVTGRGYRFIMPVRTLGVPVPPPPPSANAGPAHNLPIGTTRIFGRTDVIDTLLDELASARLVSIVGPGGIGKTTVALAIAERSLGRFSEGVWLVDLATLKDPCLVPNAIAAALGVGGTSPDMLAAACDFLRGREMLLVLDNCEHVIDAAAQCVARVLATGAGVRVLATSREPLMVSRERVRRLLGLTSPPEGTTLPADDAMQYPAVQLFVERATERVEGYRLTDADVPLVADICRRLDGMALAIELVATRVDVFGVAGLLSQLTARVPVPAGRRAGPERQRTLAAAIDWSVDLLSPHDATFLRAMAVFAGPFYADAAQEVAGTSRAVATTTLARLADKSLVSTDIDGDHVAYRLLETTRDHGLARLHATGELPTVRRRHAAHVCAVLERATSEWAMRPADEWGAAHGRVIDDLRSALDWAYEDDRDRALRIRLTLAGILLWNHFSLTEECRRHVAKAVGELDAAALGGTEYEMKLKLWLGGSSMYTEGLGPVALSTLHRALAIAIRLGHTEYRLRCLMMIGIFELFTGAPEAGLRSMEAFTALASTEDPSVLPEGEIGFAIAELFLGRLEQARQRVLQLQRRDLRYFGTYVVRYVSDATVMVGSLLTQVHWLTGRPDTAMRTAAETIDLAGRTPHHLSMNNVLSYACPVSYWCGDLDACEHHVALLEDHVLRHGFVARRPVAAFYRAALDLARHGTSIDGVDRLQRAIEDFRRTNHLARLPYYLSVLADAQRGAGLVADADATIRQALATAHDQDEGWCLPEVLRVQAAVLVAQGRHEEAERRLLKSMDKAETAGALSWQLRAATDLAALRQQVGKATHARPMLQAVLDRFAEGFTTRDLRAAAALLAT